MTSIFRRCEKKARRRLFLHIQPERMTSLDWLAMMAVTLIYAFVAFLNLGSLNIPETFYTTQNRGEEISVEFESSEDISTIKYFTSFGNGKLSFLYSLDSEGYTELTTYVQSDEIDEEGNPIYTYEPFSISHDAIDMYEWQLKNVDSFNAKYVNIRVEEPGVQILEMAFCDSSGTPVKIVSAESLNPDAMRGNSPDYMFDEQQYVPYRTSHMSEMYFDEVFHARTAYEHILHMHPYEVTHPPLGKTIISTGIRIFGMNPFGWRFMGTLFGVLMLPMMYILAKRMLKKTLYAFIPTFLFAVDFMHFSQTRIATIDSYSVFFILAMYLFMYLYTEKNYNTQKLRSTLLPLAFSGIAFGLGAATKWLCLYSGIGLAFIFFFQMAKRWQEYRFARKTVREVSVYEGMDESKRKYLMDISKNFKKKAILTLMWCILFFIIVPAVIYYLSYIPYMKATENPYDFYDVLKNQEYMLWYHGDYMLNVDVQWGSSKWYTWPIDYKPMWFFQGQNYPQELTSTLSSFGNPAVWWGGIASVIALVFIRLFENKPSRQIMFVSIAAITNFLPWVLVQRQAYIYHYFATVPFVILLMGFLAKYVIEKFRHGKKFVIAFLALCLLLFILFYPVISGLPFSRPYCTNFLRWFGTWPFY